MRNSNTMLLTIEEGNDKLLNYFLPLAKYKM